MAGSLAGVRSDGPGRYSPPGSSARSCAPAPASRSNGLLPRATPAQHMRVDHRRLHALVAPTTPAPSGCRNRPRRGASRNCDAACEPSPAWGSSPAAPLAMSRDTLVSSGDADALLPTAGLRPARDGNTYCHAHSDRAPGTSSPEPTAGRPRRTPPRRSAACSPLPRPGAPAASARTTPAASSPGPCRPSLADDDLVQREVDVLHPQPQALQQPHPGPVEEPPDQPVRAVESASTAAPPPRQDHRQPLGRSARTTRSWSSRGSAPRTTP